MSQPQLTEFLPTPPTSASPENPGSQPPTSTSPENFGGQPLAQLHNRVAQVKLPKLILGILVDGIHFGKDLKPLSTIIPQLPQVFNGRSSC